MSELHFVYYNIRQIVYLFLIYSGGRPWTATIWSRDRPEDRAAPFIERIRFYTRDKEPKGDGEAKH
jgi:hypothetical protein